MCSVEVRGQLRGVGFLLLPFGPEDHSKGLGGWCVLSALPCSSETASSCWAVLEFGTLGSSSCFYFLHSGVRPSNHCAWLLFCDSEGSISGLHVARQALTNRTIPLSLIQMTKILMSLLNSAIFSFFHFVTPEAEGLNRAHWTISSPVIFNKV